MNQTELIEIFTDGACRGNPGPGGWGAVLHYGGQSHELYGGAPHTTNNRMELTAAIQALSTLQSRSRVKLTTDSEYLRKGITEWMAQWKKRQWKNHAKQPVKNRDLWEHLDRIVTQHDISWHWVKGHSGHPENDRADALAQLGIQQVVQKRQ